MPDPVRILIVDDHPLFREGVAHSLASGPDFEIVAQAGSGEEGIATALRLRPDMVLMDLHMPGIGGIVAAQRIAEALPEVRIMMLTVAENRDSLLAALKSGAHGYVLKGVSAAELRTITRNVAHGEAYVTPALAIDLLAEFSRPRANDPFSSLTAREVEVLDLLSRGMTNREIGDALHLAEKTVKHHMTSILQKLHVRTRTEAALIAVHHGAPASPQR